MKATCSAILILLTSLVLVTDSLGPTGRPQLRAGDHGPRATKPEREREESPPEDWFITQRVAHGGIPVGALEKAGAQAAALAVAVERSEPNAPAAAKWRFAGPTNIGGRVVDIAVDPVAADTIYVAAATGWVRS